MVTVTVKQITTFAHEVNEHANHMRWSTWTRGLQETGVRVADAARPLIDAGLQLGCKEEWLAILAIEGLEKAATHADVREALTDARRAACTAFACALVRANALDAPADTETDVSAPALAEVG